MTALALVCAGCGSDLVVDVHRADCGGFRSVEIGRPAWQVLRLAAGWSVDPASLEPALLEEKGIAGDLLHSRLH